jgi:hypothetical protein
LRKIYSGDISNSEAWIWDQFLPLLFSEIHKMIYDDANFLSSCIR